MKKLAEAATELLINLENLAFISSAGLRLILQTEKLVRGRNGALKVCGATGVVKEVMDISGFDNLLDLHDDETSALDSF